MKYNQMQPTESISINKPLFPCFFRVVLKKFMLAGRLELHPYSNIASHHPVIYFFTSLINS